MVAIFFSLKTTFESENVSDNIVYNSDKYLNAICTKRTSSSYKCKKKKKERKAGIYIFSQPNAMINNYQQHISSIAMANINMKYYRSHLKHHF